MELPGLDLNLLVVLNALLTERNVTRAGEKIGLSQPATSAALARLRRHFGDELLERVGSRYELTTMAMALLDQSDIALRYVEHAFAARPLFDAAKSEREFRIAASDYAISVIGRHLSRLLAERAPDTRLCIHPLDQPTVDDAAGALRMWDAMLLPHGYLTDLPGKFLFSDEWVIIAARGRSEQVRRMSVQDMAAARWVIIYDRPTQFTPADKTLQLLGVERRADIVVENFATVAPLIAGCDRLALVPRMLANRHLALDDIEIITPPIELPALRENVWWHPSHASDPGHSWLVQLIIEAAAAAVGEKPDPLAEGEPGEQPDPLAEGEPGEQPDPLAPAR